tara:strand:+ start:401 stop:1285 length:885 start_codon:yes stop_codon:yes gene_type:complete
MIQLILTYGHSEFTRVCIDSVYKNTPKDEINLIVWDNFSEDRISESDIDPENTVLIKAENNYGVSIPINFLIKEVGQALDDDVFYISNDHYLFPGWIDPLLGRSEFNIFCPWIPFGLDGIMNGYGGQKQSKLIDFWSDEKIDLHNSIKAEYLDHPESSEKIMKFFNNIYPDGEDRFVKDNVLSQEPVSYGNVLWMGCFGIKRSLLDIVPEYKTNVGLASTEDYIWQCETRDMPQVKMGVYNHSYAHHFQCITGQRVSLSMDHEHKEFEATPPELSGRDREEMDKALAKIKKIKK